MISETNNEALRYAGLLKGNYRKGISNLRHVLSAKETADDFCRSGGVTVVFGIENKDGQYIHDPNSAQLLALLKEEGYYDAALLTFLSLGLGQDVASFDSLLSNTAQWKACREDGYAVTAMIGSTAFVSKLISTSGKLSDVINTPLALKALTASETAMKQVAASETAMKQVAASETAMKQVAASETAMKQVAASETAMKQVAASETAMKQVIANANALKQVIASETAMKQVAASETAMKQVAASAVALREIVKNAKAKDAVTTNNTVLQKHRLTIRDTVRKGSAYFTLTRAQQDDDYVSNANITNANAVVLAIPGSYNNSTSGGTTVMLHGHNGKQAASQAGNYADESRMYIGIGGATFTESGDGMVRTWVYTAK